LEAGFKKHKELLRFAEIHAKQLNKINTNQVIIFTLKNGLFSLSNKLYS
jgi:hypothetical protein